MITTIILLSFLLMSTRGACEEGQWVKALADRLDDLKSTPRIHVVGEENWLLLASMSTATTPNKWIV